ncbi:MAG TPA: hypothetical protein VKB37_20970, partial [Jatrophihabitantaceae bacterium]|nr:hypothetical protein [Jatrophihabitantaceae bacterium]
EREGYPAVPAGYFPPAAQTMLSELRAAATAGARNPELIEQFPTRELLKLVSSPWRRPAVQLYANWLLDVRRRVGSRAVTG